MENITISQILDGGVFQVLHQYSTCLVARAFLREKKKKIIWNGAGKEIYGKGKYGTKRFFDRKNTGRNDFSTEKI